MSNLDQWLRWALKIQPILAIIPIVGFIVVYQARGKWWRSGIGRYMMGSMIAWCFIIGLTIVLQFFQNIPHLLFIGFMTWNLIIAIKTWSFIVIIRSMVMKNYDEQEETDREEMDDKYHH